jgi:hypothetical protein
MVNSQFRIDRGFVNLEKMPTVRTALTVATPQALRIPSWSTNSMKVR